MCAHKPLLVALFVTVLRSSAILLVSGPAFADTSGTLNVSTDTMLYENHNGDVVIVADGVTLDCKGRTINGGGLVVGILVNGRTNVTIKNCVVTGFNLGVLLFDATNNVLCANTASRNDFGFAFMFSSANRVFDNTGNQNTFSGFAPGASSGNVFTRNRANHNGRNGFEIHVQSNNNTFNDNTANGNGVFGIALNTSSNNRLNRNVANGNAVSGFSLAELSDLNVFQDNQTVNNGFSGIDLRRSSGNMLLDNTLRNNLIGFYFEASSSNTVRGNNACPNRQLDAFQDAASVGNVFENNRFCQTEGL